MRTNNSSKRHVVKIPKKARFIVDGIPAWQMVSSIGIPTTNDIKGRLALALDVYDAPAPALAERYAKVKQLRYHAEPIRNWWRTGRTMRSMKVLRANTNQCTIGFTDAITNGRAFFNNRRWRQFGVSIRERVTLADRVVRLYAGKIAQAISA